MINKKFRIVSAALLLAAVVTVSSSVYTAFAQTGTQVTPTVTPTVTPNTGTGGTGTSGAGLTPGVPNTGAGGDLAWTLAILLASGIAAVGGASYVSRNTIGLR